MSLEKIEGSHVFVGPIPHSITPFVDAKIKILFAVHMDEELKKALIKKGIKVQIVPPILDPEISPKLMTKITTLANKSKGNVAFTCLAGAHVSNAYAGTYLIQKGWPLNKIMKGLDKISVKVAHHHISPGLAVGIRETIKFSQLNFLKTVGELRKQAKQKRAMVKKKPIKKKTTRKIK